MVLFTKDSCILSLIFLHRILNSCRALKMNRSALKADR